MTPIDELRRTMARLRAPDGCPWDREQTHQTLARCLIDECSELLDTIDRNDLPHMREELGDVLIQVVFHAQLAAERGDFDFDDVARGISESDSSHIPRVSAGLMPNPPISIMVAERPVPKSMRPLQRISSVPDISAARHG